MDEGGGQRGTATLSVGVSGETATLTAHYESGANTDTTSVVVDSATLKPVSSTREIVNDNEDDPDLIEVEYTEDGASIRVGDRQSGLSVPEHSYDNDSSLFLWRTLEFSPGYEAAYNTIITNQRSRQKVVLQITGKESVTVPAGEFEAWRLEILTSNARQTAWIADTDQRPIVRYDNDRGTIFELLR